MTSWQISSFLYFLTQLFIEMKNTLEVINFFYQKKREELKSLYKSLTDLFSFKFLKEVIFPKPLK